MSSELVVLVGIGAAAAVVVGLLWKLLFDEDHKNSVCRRIKG